MPACGCNPGARGTCPHSVACPRCKARPGRPCKRPSGHACEMHAERYRQTEMEDAEDTHCKGESLLSQHELPLRPSDFWRGLLVERRKDGGDLLVY